jgi:hypothetical protein
MSNLPGFLFVHYHKGFPRERQEENSGDRAGNRRAVYDLPFPGRDAMIQKKTEPFALFWR